MNQLTDQLINTAEALAPYDQGDLLASVAALQLVPENGDRLTRLELLAHVVASVHQQNGNKISVGRLKKLCNGDPISSVSYLEDSADRFLAEAVMHFGGTHRVFPGLSADSPYVCQRLIEVFADKGGPLTTELRERCNSLLYTSVHLSELIAQKANIARGSRTDASPGGATMIPSRERLSQLKDAVTFDLDEVASLMESHDLTDDFLDLLSVSAGDINLSDVDPWTGDLFVRPFVRIQSGLVLSVPGALLSATRNAVTGLAIGYGEHEQLSDAYCSAVWNNVRRSLFFIGHHEVASLEVSSSTIRDGVFTLDVGKQLYVSLLTDDLSDYDTGDTFGSWDAALMGKKRRDKVVAQAAALGDRNSDTSDVMVVLLTQSLGRAYSLRSESLPSEEVENWVHFTADDLDTVSLVEDADPLLLWKFGWATRRLKAQSTVVPTGTLSKFAYYRSQKYSYYGNDDIAPTMLMVSDDLTHGLRAEAFRKSDRHGVLSLDRSHWVEVISNARDVRLPLYVELVPQSDHVSFLVERLPLPVWVASPALTSDRQLDLRGTYLMFVECIAYWLWQFSPELTPILEPMRGRFPNLVIQVVLPENEVWGTIPRDEIGTPLQDDSVSSRSSSGVGGISLTIHSRLLAASAVATNEADRFLMRIVLGELRNVLPDPSALSGELIEEIIARHAPIGRKKMILILNADAAFGVSRQDLPAFRPPKDADIEELLDDLGDHLTSNCKVAPGELSGSDRTPFINNKVVAWFYSQLVSYVAGLDQRELAKELVLRHEAILQRQESTKLTIPTRLACYGFDENLRDEITNELHELDTAAVTTRFLIEYVAAEPPSGTRPFSTADYDHLLALAWHIVQFGFISDTIQYEIADVRVSMLRSGRLGLDRSVYDSVARPFMRSVGSERMEMANQGFERYWRSESQEQAFPALEANAPFEAECGYSLEEVLAFCRFLLRDVNVNLSAIRNVPVDKFLKQAAGDLNWTEPRVEGLLSILALSQRAQFLNPGPPHRGIDVWPWRFNRRLSYLRRPVLIVGVEPDRHILWGVRQVNQSVRYLLDLLFSGRLPAFGAHQSSLMSTFLGLLNQNRGPRFERQVEELLLTNGIPVARSLKRLVTVKVGAIGEIDIVAANVSRRILYVIECKDIALAKTPYEMGQQIKDLYDPDLNQKSAVSQALKKATWIEQNLDACLARLNIANTSGSWTIVPAVVIDQPMLTPHFAGAPIDIVAVQYLIGTFWA